MLVLALLIEAYTASAEASAANMSHAAVAIRVFFVELAKQLHAVERLASACTQLVSV